MTDSSDEAEPEQSKPTERSIDTRVPADTDWELKVQLSFENEGNQELASTIIEGVAEAEGVSPKEIKEPTLYEVLDVPALEEALFGPSNIQKQSSDLRQVEFMYRNHQIVIRSDGWVQVHQSI